MNEKEAFLKLPASCVWDDDNKVWIVQGENNVKIIEKLNSKYLTSLSVRRSTIGLLPKDQTTPALIAKIYSGTIDKAEENFDRKCYFELNGNTVFEYLANVEENEEEKWAKFTIAYKKQDSKEYTIAVGTVYWGEQKPETQTPPYIHVSKEYNTIESATDGAPIILTESEAPPSSLFKTENLCLKPGYLDDVIIVNSDNIKAEGVCPPYWPEPNPNSESETVIIKPFIGAPTSLLDTPLRPDLRG